MAGVNGRRACDSLARRPSWKRPAGGRSKRFLGWSLRPLCGLMDVVYRRRDTHLTRRLRRRI